MADLSITYMGLPLKNPVIVGSSGLTQSVDGVRKCEEAGAGAVVLKSLFEEQIEGDIQHAENEASLLIHTEAHDYIHQTALRISQDKYLNLIKEAKQEVSIPVIASLNCIRSDWWTNYAVKMAEAGADAIELNIAIMPTYIMQTAGQVEALYLRIVDSVRSKVDIPLAVKIGPYFTSLPHMARALGKAGADLLVLFHRFCQFDIDIDKMSLKYGYRFSAPQDIHVPLRWIAILSSQVGCELAATAGIYSGADVIKQLLAGSQAVHVCSALYQKGLDRIGEILRDLEEWMDEYGYTTIDEFRGKMSMELEGKPEFYQRLQYIKVFSGVE
jgi:dihydroorotate dehydrogenase (fumarate)